MAELNPTKMITHNSLRDLLKLPKPPNSPVSVGAQLNFFCDKDKHRLGMRDGRIYGELSDVPTEDMEQVRRILGQNPRMWFIVSGFYIADADNPHFPPPRIVCTEIVPVKQNPPSQFVEPAEWIGDKDRCEDCGSYDHSVEDCDCEEVSRNTILCKICTRYGHDNYECPQNITPSGLQGHDLPPMNLREWVEIGGTQEERKDGI